MLNKITGAEKCDPEITGQATTTDDSSNAAGFIKKLKQQMINKIIWQRLNLMK